MICQRKGFSGNFYLYTVMLGGGDPGVLDPPPPPIAKKQNDFIFMFKKNDINV